jgi:hypothetical protein
MNELDNQFVSSQISILFFMMNFGIAFILSALLGFHYKKFATVIANRDELAKIFPFITLTTLIIITIVKSSLALSLGLVGALSIVRFRTPIKEPEELAYLFICIAIGIGLGANQTVTTVLGFFGLILVSGLFRWKTSIGRGLGRNVYLTISDAGNELSIQKLTGVIDPLSEHCDLRRTYLANNGSSATFSVFFSSIEDLDKAIEELRKIFPEAEITFVDQSHMPGT